MKGLPFVMIAAIGIAAAPVAFGQSAISAQAGMVHYVEGDVFLKDQAVMAKFGQFPQVKENEVIRTEAGRAEILLTPGAFLRLAENSSARMISTRLVDARLEVLSGSAIIEVADLLKENQITVVCKDATVSLLKHGLYRFDAAEDLLRVYDGEAAVSKGGQEFAVKTAHELTLTGEKLEAAKFDNKEGDSFYRWGSRRSEAMSLASISAARSIRNLGMGWSSNNWYYNPYLGMFGFVPYSGRLMSPYGFAFFSPSEVAYLNYPNYGYYGSYQPKPSTPTSPGGSYGYSSSLGYNTAARGSHDSYSGFNTPSYNSSSASSYSAPSSSVGSAAVSGGGAVRSGGDAGGGRSSGGHGK